MVSERSDGRAGLRPHSPEHSQGSHEQSTDVHVSQLHREHIQEVTYMTFLLTLVASLVLVRVAAAIRDNDLANCSPGRSQTVPTNLQKSEHY